MLSGLVLSGHCTVSGPCTCTVPGPCTINVVDNFTKGLFVEVASHYGGDRLHCLQLQRLMNTAMEREIFLYELYLEHSRSAAYATYPIGGSSSTYSTQVANSVRHVHHRGGDSRHLTNYI